MTFDLDRAYEEAKEIAAKNGFVPEDAEPWRRPYNAPEPVDIWHDGVTAAELDAMEFPPIKWVVPGFVAEGCTLLAGRPKLGKSWWVLDASLAVASGGDTLGQKCEEGDVLYLALEDNKRRLQSRIRRLWPDGSAMPKRLRMMTKWPSGIEGVAAIRRWIKATPGARLVIVDVLAMFKGATPAKGRETLYEADYLALKGLQSVAMDTGVAIVVVHHTRKSGSEEDPFEKVSGTLGLSAAADTTIVLDRDGQGCTLYGRGRDVEEFETAVTFDKLSCRWQALGEAAEVRRSDERTAILDVLKQAGEPMPPRDISDETEMPYEAARKTLQRMARAGEVTKAGRGMYVHPDHHTPPVPTVPMSQVRPVVEPAGGNGGAEATKGRTWDIGTVGTGGIVEREERERDWDSLPACAHCGEGIAEADITNTTDGTRSARIHRDCFDAWFADGGVS